jgi:hypothetical protein
MSDYVDETLLASLVLKESWIDDGNGLIHLGSECSLKSDKRSANENGAAVVVAHSGFVI